MLSTYTLSKKVYASINQRSKVRKMRFFLQASNKHNFTFHIDPHPAQQHLQHQLRLQQQQQQQQQQHGKSVTVAHNFAVLTSR